MREGKTGQHDALLMLAIAGAKRWYDAPETALLPTEKVKADTRDWRCGSDRILGYWNEYLIADPSSKILCTDMLEDFNRWLKGNGHHEWAAETFGPKFAAHAETLRHNVEFGRKRDLTGLSRPTSLFGFGLIAPPTGRQRLWRGVRYRTAADDAADELRAASKGQGGPGTQAGQA